MPLRDTLGVTQPCPTPTPGLGLWETSTPQAAKETGLGAREERCCQIWGTLKY